MGIERNSTNVEPLLKNLLGFQVKILKLCDIWLRSAEVFIKISKKGLEIRHAIKNVWTKHTHCRSSSKDKINVYLNANSIQIIYLIFYKATRSVYFQE